MTRPHPNPFPALAVTSSVVFVTSFVTLVPRTSWLAIAVPVLLVLGLIRAGLLHLVRMGRRRPSAGAPFLAAATSFLGGRAKECV